MRREVLVVVVLAVVVACGDSSNVDPSGSGGNGGGTGGQGEAGSASGGGGQGGDGAGGATDCGTGQPVTAPDDTWTYVPVDGSVCGTAGTTAGFFINPSPTSKRLAIFFQGGGACFSQSDCQSANLNGFDPNQMLSFLPVHPLFNRSLASNPLADFDFVFVPYCTGDLHSGSNTASYGMQHHGYDNVTLYLERVLATFCDADYVLVTGTSAGGFGAAFNYDRIHQLYPSIPVDLVDDSGPYMHPPYMPPEAQETIDMNWGFRANMPPGCSQCATTWHALYQHASSSWPNDRLSLISSVRDPSIQGRFQPYSSALQTLDDFEVGIDDFAATIVGPLANMHVFYVATQGHVYLDSPLNQTFTSGVSLETFLRQQIDDDPTWSDVRP